MIYRIMKLNPGVWPSDNVIYVMCTPSVALGTASLKFVVEAVYVGHIISSNLKDD